MTDESITHAWKLALLTDDNDDFKMLDAVSDLLRCNILSITRELDAYCDGAKARDFVGFDQVDTHIGKTIARVGIGRPEKCHQVGEKIKKNRSTPVYFNSRELQMWARKLYKYREQIEGDFLERLFVGEKDGR